MKKKVYLTVLAISIIVILNITNQLAGYGYDSASAVIIASEASDKRLALELVALFCIVGYFYELISEKFNKDKNDK